MNIKTALVQAFAVNHAINSKLRTEKHHKVRAIHRPYRAGHIFAANTGA